MSGTIPSKTLRELDVEKLASTNPFVGLVKDQRIVEVPELTLESGVTIRNFPIAYKSWGSLNAEGDNCMVICHALTGSSDVSDWWGPLLGDNMAFDPSRFLVICLNSMGSPYGSFSPLSINIETGRPYGPEFPLCTVRDDVTAHKIVLESLGVKSVACVVGGSMGGMTALEWATMHGGDDYVKSVIALATSARHSAWCISWSEAQRQSIYSDPKYQDGYYSLDDPPTAGLSAARMSALLTYRSRNSFEKKFSRRVPSAIQSKKAASPPSHRPTTVSECSLQIHNDGHTPSDASQKCSSISPSTSANSLRSLQSTTSLSIATGEVKEIKPAQTYFSAQSYLRYQGNKFISRFDANCYIAITRKLDTHDLARGRYQFDEDIHLVLNSIEIPALIIGINSDGLFTYFEQEVLAENIPHAHLEKIESPEGHDAFLLEFTLINELMIRFLKEEACKIMEASPRPWKGQSSTERPAESVFGEAEEVTNW